MSSTYANAPTNVQSLIDGEGISAITLLENEASWFSLVAPYTTDMGTGLATGLSSPDSWEPWLVSEVALRCDSQNVHPDRTAAFKLRDQDREACIASYSKNAVNYDVTASSEGVTFHILNNRLYCYNSCKARKIRPMPTPEFVDSAFWETATFVWNKANWRFRKRPVTIKITRTTFSGATWTESTKTLLLTGSVTAPPVGTAVFITSGTGATVNEYPYTSWTTSTSTSIVLVNSIGSTADAQTDIAGFFYQIEMVGLQSGETFDSLASVQLSHADSGVTGRVVWCTSDEFARVRSIEGITPARPIRFRLIDYAPNLTQWLFHPPPDDNYSMRAEIITRQPAAPGSKTETTCFTKYATEFQTTMRRLQLDRVLTNCGRTDEQLHREVMDEVESLFAIYQDSAGYSVEQLGTQDIYKDQRNLDGVWPLLGPGGI